MIFRRDLRLRDNPALRAAVKRGQPIVAVYMAETDDAPWSPGGASKVWLHHSLTALNESLSGKLGIVAQGDTEALRKLIASHDIDAAYWNEIPEPEHLSQDKNLEKIFQKQGVMVETSNAALLWRAEDIRKKNGSPYKRYTPFYRACRAAPPPRPPLPAIQKDDFVSINSRKIDDLHLLPEKPRWDEKLLACWDIGEAGAHKTLKKFLKNDFEDYREGRDFPSRMVLSRLSPHLHFGEISPHQIWHAVQKDGVARNRRSDLQTFLSELAWREFSYYLLNQFPALPDRPWEEKFSRMRWRSGERHLTAWQKGLTGYPIVDAGMRELWETGYMHNRVRMITASFLIKHLGINWVTGEKWFWDCLVDADLAVNAFNWQWVAGSGADASPFFRVFNPILQGEKFDGRGDYVRKWVPEIAGLPDKFLHRPWEAPQSLLETCGIVLGKTYPGPVVEHERARERALDAYKALRR
jgi:deoxyribodipyrimidine photo-lyase